MVKKVKRNKILSTFLIGTCLFALASCGSDDDDNGGSTAQPQQQTDEGIYRVVLEPLNTTAPDGSRLHDLEGTVVVRIEGDQMNVVTAARNAPSGVHRQHIHLGTSCATMANDTNGDGFVDMAEASQVTGPALIPLDGNLDTQEEGSDSYPSGRIIAYTESTTLSEMMSDLQAADPNPNDSLAKLPAGESLNLDGRVVEIHGIGSGVTLPDTVVGDGTLSPNESLPIACGVLRRVLSEDDGTNGGATAGATGGATGGETGGATGGETGGATGGETGGATGGEAGGATGGSTGGTTPTT